MQPSNSPLIDGRISPFPYRSLRDDGEIRLLYLHPPTGFDGVNEVPALDMFVVDLDESTTCPQYFALSYTWGPPTIFPLPQLHDERKISMVIVNGRLFRVEPNLFHALQQISRSFYKDTSKPLFIWIDAICINQNDNEEKNRQVQRMGEIYSKSRRTVVWLGLADDTTKQAFVKLHQIAKDYDEQNDAAEARGEDPYGGYSVPYMLILGRKLTTEEMDGTNTLEIKELDHLEGLPQITQLMNRYWWERSWIWQEVVRARSTFVICGPYEADFNIFIKMSIAIMIDINTSARFGYLVPGMFYRRLEFLFSVVTTMTKMRMFFAPATNVSDSSSMNMATVLENLRHTAATNARDKVFAGLGLCDASHGVHVDYNSPVTEIYINVVQRHIITNQDLSIFSHCQYPPLLDGLPTWVPDWTDRVVRRHPLGRPSASLDWGEKLYPAGGAHFITPITEISEGNPKALVLGSILCNIVFVAETDSSFSEIAYSSDRESSTYQQFVRGATSALLQCSWLRQWACFNPDGGLHRTLIHKVAGRLFSRGRLKRRIIFLWRGWWKNNRHHHPKQFVRLSYRFTGESLLQAYTRTLYADAITSYTNSSKKCAGDWDQLPFDAGMDCVLIGRTFATTKDDAFALVPVETQVGDVVALFMGGEVLNILRPTEDGYMMIGDCYLHGFMDGEGFDVIEKTNGWEMISLI